MPSEPSTDSDATLPAALVAALPEAVRRISPFVHRTPILTSSRLNGRYRACLFFKCENFQKVGAFKARGAFNAVLSLADEEARRGIVTHSSGNHAAAVALAARTRGVPAFIVMPNNAPAAKIAAVREYGGVITFCEPRLADRDNEANRIIQETGARFVPPYDDARIVCGAATATLELLQDVDDLDLLICPVGGGGLLAGAVIAKRYLGSTVSIIAAEPAGANDAWQSFNADRLIPQESPNTIADGLLTSLGYLNFEIIRAGVSQVLLAKEASIVRCMRDIWESMKIIVEPSAAVTLAALLDWDQNLSSKRIGIILSGGNVDLDQLPWLIAGLED